MAKCEIMAINDTSGSINNEDIHEYFSENTLSLP